MSGGNDKPVKEAEVEANQLAATVANAPDGAAKAAFASETRHAAGKIKPALCAFLVLIALGGIIYCDAYWLFPRVPGWAGTIVIGVFEAVAVAVLAELVGVSVPSTLFGNVFAKLIAPHEK